MKAKSKAKGPAFGDWIHIYSSSLPKVSHFEQSMYSPKREYYDETNSLSENSLLTTYATIDAVKESGDSAEKSKWILWNSQLLELLSEYGKCLGDEPVYLSSLRDVFKKIPSHYCISSRFQNLESELGGRDVDFKVSAKSLFCMLRFLPLIEEKNREVYFNLDDETGWFGISFSRYIQNSEEDRKTLDVIFKDDGEIYFTFIEGGQGFSRISGSSFLTEYLVNSPKFRKILNIFDY